MNIIASQNGWVGAKHSQPCVGLKATMLQTQSDFGTGFSRFQILEPEKLGDFQRYSEHEASSFVGDSDLSQRVASLKLTVIGYCDEES